MIEFASADVGADERTLVDRVLTSGRLSRGPVVDELEQAFACRFGAAEAIAVSSGTAGLHLALIAAGVEPGDCVLTSPFSFIATANAILYEGGVPLFVDIDPETLLVDAAGVLEALDDVRRGRFRGTLVSSGARAGARLRAVMPVHLFGRVINLTAVAESAAAAGVALVEDACEAIGAAHGHQLAGRWGQNGVFGFYPNKPITMGEGGMVVTDDAAIAARVWRLRNHGHGPGGEIEMIDRPGYNYRLDELSAALGLAQLRRLDGILAARERVAERYAARLAEGPIAPALRHGEPGLLASWFAYPIRLSAGTNRRRVRQRLAERGVPTRVYFEPIHCHPLYRQRFGYAPGMFPHAEAAGRSLLALPFHTKLTDGQIDFICGTLEDAVQDATA